MSNQDTHAIWNGQSGADWARFQPDLDLFLADSMAKLAALLPLAPNAVSDARVLEIGSGAGSFSLMLAKSVGPEGRVLGLDVSDRLLEVARGRVAGAGQGNLSYRKLDIQTEDLDAGGFDICAAHVGMMFFSDPVLALTRIRRHLSPGATIAFNGWANAENPWFSVPQAVAERHLGPLPAPPAGQKPPPGPLAFANVMHVTALLAQSGYDRIEGWQERIRIRHPKGLEALMQSLTYVGPISTLYRLKQPDPAQRARIDADLRIAMAPYIDRNGHVEMPGTMAFYRAVAP